MHGDDGVAAECLLEAFGYVVTDTDSDAAYARAFVGAVLVAEGLRELGLLRRILVKVFTQS